MSSLELPNPKNKKKPNTNEKNAPLIEVDNVNQTPKSLDKDSLESFDDSKEYSHNENAISPSGRLIETSDSSGNNESGANTDNSNNTKNKSGEGNTNNKNKKKEKSLIDIAKSMSKEAKKVSFQRLLRQSKREAKLLGFGIFFTLLNSIITLCTPIIMGAIISSISIDGVSKSDLTPPVTYICDISPLGCNGNSNLLYTSIYTLFILALFGAIFAFGKWTALEIAGERVVARLRKILFHRILCQDVGLFDVTKTGELVNRLSTDTTVLKSACTTQVAQSLSSLTGVILSIFYVFYLSWRLTCVMLGIVPIVVIVGKVYGAYYRKQSKLNQDFLAEATQVATESIGLIRTVKSFSKEDFEEMKYCQAIDNTYKQGVKMAMANGGFMAFFSVISNVGIGSVLWYGATLTFHGSLNTGSLTTYVILTIQIGFQFSSLINLYTNVMKALGASERVFQLIDRKPEISTTIPSNGNVSNQVVNPFGVTKNDAITLSKLHIGESGRDGFVGNKEIYGNVEIKNVTFGYPSRPALTVLKNLCLDVSPGKITALVGESGGGKSTVAKLVMRFYDPNEGTITIDGRSLKDYDLRWLHQQIGLVSQEPLLFGTTIRENIIYGVRQKYYDFLSHINEFDAFGRNKNSNSNKLFNKNRKNGGILMGNELQYSQLNAKSISIDVDSGIGKGSTDDIDRNNNNGIIIDDGIMGRHVTDDDVINAAKQANAHNFIMSFPEGYDTLVGERGIRLSGGQKQRVAIARAILMNPKILLLDEATSALDSESEYLVQQALDRIMVGRSVLVIAHRLSTVKSADRVCVIERGKVVESGTHEELISNENGSYTRLVKRQLFEQ